MVVFLLYFCVSRLIDLTTAYVIPQLIPYLGFFPYKDILVSYHLPQFLYSFANFDGAHYISIAKMGYNQFEQAFFPLYPLLIRLLSSIFSNNHLIIGLIISNISFLAGLIVFKKYLDALFYKKQTWIIILLLFFPTSFFFGTLYTEGLFFFLTISALYFLKKERYLLVGLFGFLSALTRFIGVFLIIPIIIRLIYLQQSNKKGRNKYLIPLFFPLLGLMVYSFYLWQTTNDPLYFFHSQSSFGLNRTTNLVLLPQVYYRYFKIILTASYNFQYFISLFELTIFTFVLIVLFLDLRQITKNFKQIIFSERLGLNLFSFFNLLIPTFTGTFLSVPRFALLSLSFFIFLGQTPKVWVKTVIAGVFILMHILILGLFIQGYFVS